MKFKFTFFILLTLLIIQVSTQINLNLFKNKNISYLTNQNKIRKISEDDNYEPIRIQADFSYLKYQSKYNSNLFQIEKQIEDSVVSSIKTIKKLINVKPLFYPINKITTEDLSKWNLKSLINHC